jgi:glycosyltransferase involved in cell wall biosynthesis
LIRAFRIINSEFPHTALTLVGPLELDEGGGGAGYAVELELLAQGLPVVFKRPLKDPKELASELRAASLFCYPSLAEKGESFGVAPLEAMATGLAVVVSNLAVFTDFIEDGETGLVFDHKSSRPSQDLASKLRTLILDDELRGKIERQAASKALQFDYDTVAEAYLNDFTNLAQAADAKG